MLFFQDLASLSLAILLLCSSASAAPSNDLSLLDRRDGSDNPVNSTATNETTTSLEPVLPPAVDPEDFSILSLDKSVTLAWAGSATVPGSRRMMKRADGIFAQANFTFRYPTIPLDHSDFVTDITCKTGRLTARLSSSAYQFAKNEWKGAVPIIFVTAVDGCGDDNENEFFIVKSINFSDSGKTFTAKGVSAGYRDVTTYFNLKWGNVGSLKLRRSMNKRDSSESSSLRKRVGKDSSSQWNIKLNDFLPSQPDAPWNNAGLLYTWSLQDGAKDITKSWSKGQADSTKEQSDNPTKPLKSPVDYGLAMYCVECGFSGSSTIHGEIEAWPQLSRPYIKVNKVQAGFNANFQAGINLGMEAYAKYTKEFKTEFQKIPLNAFTIPKLALLGPFVSVGVEATASIKASGALLMGSSARWDNINAQIDLLNSQNSYANNFSPSVTNEATAAGGVGAETSLGMPLKLGIGIDLLSGSWKAEAVIVNTPAVVVEANFKVTAGTSTGVDVNGGCYGINWEARLENTLQAVAEIKPFNPYQYDLITPLEYPLAAGCIGYTVPEPACSKSDIVSTPGLNPDTPLKICKKSVLLKRVAPKNLLGTATVVSDDIACATKCFKNKKCLSFGMTKKKSCQLYNASYRSLLLVPLAEQATQVINDRTCYAYKTCP
ncbi:hypothetical protein FSARC_7981 [Fusarium sarcochroum]|uniref:Apple domain-containing protein n=1 Tax=Fusarium sarcochroum TaxID=1208366 RepID=A0A8H4TUB6_9HYPO|nr:hypothetical protein FSARC_7981 [Fusarium sarcochroum]